ncbi:MAG: hypothetical protein LBK59_02490 [Bifidobacteriaceae bacterium]|jgi:hypothetical protein|nr:hypothetical protein [Bifidobacteriaceae bacterium]
MKQRLTRSALRLFVGALLASFLSIALGANGAYAINRINPCGSRNDWLTLYSDATTCWANSGNVLVELYNVGAFRAGNNAGSFAYYWNSSRYTRYFGKWASDPFPQSLARIVQIHVD